MKHEWAEGCKARSHGSDQVLITNTARAGLFIFNLHRYVFLEESPYCNRGMNTFQKMGGEL